MAAASLALVTSVLLWTLLRRAGLDLAGWEIATLALAPLAVVLLRRPQAPPFSRSFLTALIGLPVWVLITLPAISVAPAATFVGWLHLAGCILVFLIVRETAWRARTPWVAAFPLAAVAALEAALGLAQFYAGADAGAHGTFVNRDHFAGLLEMALPFAALYGLALVRQGRMTVAGVAAMAAAALILAGVVHSLSRMGFLCAIGGLVLAIAATLRRKRWLLGAPAAAALLFVFLPNDRMIARFAEFSTQPLDRARVWRETLPMVPDYLLTGCGLGGYESAFMKYKRAAPTVTDSYAHNDYLQALVELGLPGFLCGLVLVGAAVRAAWVGAWRGGSTERRALAAACLGSLAALLLHSLVDFNAYIPSNAMVFAWVAGLAMTPQVA